MLSFNGVVGRNRIMALGLPICNPSVPRAGNEAWRPRNGALEDAILLDIEPGEFFPENVGGSMHVYIIMS